MNVPFASFQQMHREVEKELDSAIKEVIQRNWFIRGTQNEQFEKKIRKILWNRILCWMREWVGRPYAFVKSLWNKRGR